MILPSQLQVLIFDISKKGKEKLTIVKKEVCKTSRQQLMYVKVVTLQKNFSTRETVIHHGRNRGLYKE